MTDPTIAEIQGAVAEWFGIQLIEMRSDRRARRIARPRQIAMFLARELTAHSLPTIGRLFRRDHTTVVHAIRNIERLCASDRALAAAIDRLRSRLLFQHANDNAA